MASVHAGQVQSICSTDGDAHWPQLAGGVCTVRSRGQGGCGANDGMRTPEGVARFGSPPKVSSMCSTAAWPYAAAAWTGVKPSQLTACKSSGPGQASGSRFTDHPFPGRWHECCLGPAQRAAPACTVWPVRSSAGLAFAASHRPKLTSSHVSTEGPGAQACSAVRRQAP